MGKKTIQDVDVTGKKVLVRVDYNVPVDKTTGEITNDERLKATLPTLEYLVEQKAKVILVSHMGRPKGQVVETLRLDRVAVRLSELLHHNVTKLNDCIGEEVESALNKMNDGDIVLLENVRFYPQEEMNDLAFAKTLASYADLFVNDAFGTAHRAHCSTEGVGHYLPTVAGLLIKKEISALGNAVLRPERPFVSIIGGAKISDKIGVINNMLTKADSLIIGGGMANTFLAAQGYAMKSSLVEVTKLEEAKLILKKAQELPVNLLLPVDFVVAKDIEAPETARVVDCDSLEEGDMALDIGPKTIELFTEALKSAKTIVWNGPMGVFEVDAFAKGTNAIAKAVSENKGHTVIGGGDSVAAVEKSGVADRISHISTGGGASLKFMEGKILPGLAIIAEREETANKKKPLIMANWKMNKNNAEAIAFGTELLLKHLPEKSIAAICPPFTLLPTLYRMLGESEVRLGAQNFFYEEKGSYTGEISLEMLKDFEITYVLVGHSERRQIFAENDEIVFQKYLAAAKAGIVPVLCIGEDEKTRREKEAFNFCEKQLQAVFGNIKAAELPQEIIVAYEPIWAIGTGVNASAEDAEEMLSYVRSWLTREYGEDIAQSARLLYGGSVKPENIADLLKQNNIDGVLVGGASLDVASYRSLLEGGQTRV